MYIHSVQRQVQRRPVLAAAVAAVELAAVAAVELVSVAAVELAESKAAGHELSRGRSCAGC